MICLEPTPWEVSAAFYGVERLVQAQIDWLCRRHGVSVTGLVDPDPVLTAEVAISADGLFEMGEDAPVEAPLTRCLMILARGEGGVPLDVIAWHVETGTVASWLGLCPVLGLADARFGPRLSTEGTLPVHRTPLGWLQAERRGLVIVDRSQADLLNGLGPFACEDDAHGREMHALLTRPRPAPHIVVPRARAAA